MNLKGGTGKTITAINVGAIMAREWAQRVLLADADSQANLTEFVTDGLLPDGISLGGMTDLLQKTGASSTARPASRPRPWPRSSRRTRS